MAAKARARSRDFSQQFWSGLSSAFCEWCLVVLLFAVAALSYIAVRLACICKLRPPCMLCSRLDDVINGKAWFCGDLVCAAHKLQISYLTYCCNHNKLAYIDDLCESCLISSAPLVPKLTGASGNGRNDGNGSQSMADGDDSVKEPLLEMDAGSSSRCTRLCSCCSEPFRKMHSMHGLIQCQEIGGDIANGGHPEDEMSKGKERALDMTNVHHSEDNGFDHISDDGYRKLKVASDSESEFPFSDDDDDANAMLRGASEANEGPSSHNMQPEPVNVITTTKNSSVPACADIVPEKLIHPTPPVPVNSVTGGESANAASSNAAIGHGLEEINWSQVDASSDVTTPSKHIPTQVPAEIPKEKSIEEVGDPGSVLLGEVAKDVGSSGSAKPGNTGPGLSARIIIGRNNSMKNASGHRGNLSSPRLSEKISARDNSRTQEDLKTFLSQMSSSRGLDGPWNEVTLSPKIGMHIEESKLSDASSSIGVQNSSKRSSLERNSSALEPFDLSLVSEVEGESSVDHLKQQVELDKKSMSVLYKELEAERSASAVAASEAMAMINRLQEEKASMQMEALQYLRMLEEQAEYDQEAIQKLNDLLTEREKEILDLEEELESYRSRLCNETLEGKPDAANILNHAKSVRQDSPESDRRNMTYKDLSGSDFVKKAMLDFKDEKTYISECLSRLEKKLGMPTTNKCASNLDDAKNKQEDGSLGDHARGNSEGIDNSENSQSSGEIELENGDLPSPHEHSNGESISVQQIQINGSCSNLDDDSCHLSEGKISDVTSLKDEVSFLNMKLMALETDQNFLEQMLYSIKNSSDGVQCIQEITSYLRELRGLI